MLFAETLWASITMTSGALLSLVSLVSWVSFPTFPTTSAWPELIHTSCVCVRKCVHGHLCQILWIASDTEAYQGYSITKFKRTSPKVLSLGQSCMSLMSPWLRIILPRCGKRCPKENDTIMSSHAQSCHFFREVPGFDGNPGGEYSSLKSSSFQKYSAPE